MNRRGFLGRLLGVAGALATGQAVKFSDVSSLLEPVKEKFVSYRTYIMGSQSVVSSLSQAQEILFDKELIPNLKGENDVFVKMAERGVLPGAVTDVDNFSDIVAAFPGWESYKIHQGVQMKAGVNRQFFQYDTLGKNTLPGKTHECFLDESQKLS